MSHYILQLINRKKLEKTNQAILLEEYARSAYYNEIYLKKDLNISMKDDVKGVYRKNAGRTQLVGIDATFDEPLHSDLILEVDSMTEEETFQAVLDFIVTKYGEQYR